MSKFAVIGLGRFGVKLAEYLVKQGAEVLVIDNVKELVEEVKDKVSRAVILDATDEDALKSIGLKEMDAVVVAMGEHFEASVLSVAIAKKLGIKRIIAKATSDLQGEILRLVGATEVVFPEDGEAKRVARSLIEPNILDHIRITDRQSVVKMRVPKKFIGKSIIDLNLRQKYNVTVLEITSWEEGKALTTTMPAPDYVFSENEQMVVIGEKGAIEKFKKTFGE